MRISPLLVLCIGLAIGGLAFGTCQAGRATDAEIKLEAALAAQRDSASHWMASRDSLVATARGLRADSQVLALRYATASQAARRAHRTADSLLARLPDTLRVGIRLAFDSLVGETAACQALLANCELRALNAEARAHGDSVVLAQTVLLLQHTEAAWHTEVQRNQPGFLGLRSFWRARSYTLPLAALSAFLLISRR